MSRNSIQFQHGFSLPDFMEKYGTEEQCRQAIFQSRWPHGFICPECGNPTYCQLSRDQLYQCHHCHHQASLTAGTIFEYTKLPLKIWFLAMYLLTQRKNGMSSLQLSRELGVAYNTAWKLKHKLMQVMLEHNQAQPLSGRIEIDDAYLGGARSGKRGRGAAHKVPFVAAVQTDGEGHPLYTHLRRVKDFSQQEIRRYAKNSVTPGSHMVSDGYGCFCAFEAMGYRHERIVTGGGADSVKIPAFNWVNTLLGNVKNAIKGSYHAIREQHIPRYLAEFEYRFNRRFDLEAMIPRLLTVAIRTPPMPYRLLRGTCQDS